METVSNVVKRVSCKYLCDETSASLMDYLSSGRDDTKKGVMIRLVIKQRLCEHNITQACAMGGAEASSDHREPRTPLQKAFHESACMLRGDVEELKSDLFTPNGIDMSETVLLRMKSSTSPDPVTYQLDICFVVFIEKGDELMLPPEKEYIKMDE